MGWIKRNLFFVVGGGLALALLGAAGYFIYSGWSRNAEKSSRLNEIYAQLLQYSTSPDQPGGGNGQPDNTKIARGQEEQMRDWIRQAAAYFQPIPPVPQGRVTSKTFATALGATIYQLQQEAKDSSINLPPQYCFSFQVQSSELTLSPGSLEPLAAQLGEVKAIAEILFAARINELESIQRVRVSDDDTAKGLATDYTDEQPVTNNLAIITPYVVTFRGFTPELARVIAGFANSPNPFVVKSVSVEPAGMATTTEPGAAPGYPGNPGYPGTPNYPDYRGYRGYPGNQGAYPGYRGYPGMPANGQPPGAMPAGRGGLQTILKEQLLRITLEVDVVRLLPRS